MGHKYRRKNRARQRLRRGWTVSEQRARRAATGFTLSFWTKETPSGKPLWKVFNSERASKAALTDASTISDVAVWDRVLTEGELSRVYDESSGTGF